MDLLENYLATIRWTLPRGSKGVSADDILAELRDVIGNRIEEREESLGRALNDDELGALLRDFGHPLAVAARYGPQQSLIGPDLFPFYWFALKVVVAISLAVELVGSIARGLFSDHSFIQGAMHGANGMVWTLLANAGLVTLVFAVIERTGWLTTYLRDWKPKDLPDLGAMKAKPKSPWEAMFEVAVGIAFIMWWVGIISVPPVHLDAKGLTLTPDPIWTALWAPILALMVAGLVFNLIQWLRPRWTAVRATLSIGSTAGALALLVMLYRAGHWITASSATMPADKLAEIDRSTNLGIHYAIIAVGVIWAIQCGQELWRLYLGERKKPLSM
jgi:hypothetical protein